MVKRKIHPGLLGYIDLVKGLATILGSDCEVLLHDVSRPESSIIACENGHVSGRAVESPMTNFGLLMLKTPEYRKMSGVYNYLAKTEDGRVLKCGVCFIKDDAGKIIGFLCINMDMSKALVAKDMINELFKIEIDEIMPHEVYKERFSRELDDVVSSSIASVKSKWGRDLSVLSREDKVKVMEELDLMGFFLVKGAMDRISSEMRKSKFTLYAYLREIHMNSAEISRKDKISPV